MNYLILPKKLATLESNWVESSNLTLGGHFYDYLRLANKSIAGVRYWIIEDIEFSRHPVYSQFLEDERFSFNQKNGYVDIVFNEKNVDYLRAGELLVDGVQDFGGEEILECDNIFAISFSLV